MSEPEILVYFARRYSQIELADSAVRTLKPAVQLGFLCAPETMKSDIWLSSVRGHPEFDFLLNTAEALIEKAQSSFKAYTTSTKIWQF